MEPSLAIPKHPKPLLLFAVESLHVRIHGFMWFLTSVPESLPDSVLCPSCLTLEVPGLHRKPTWLLRRLTGVPLTVGEGQNRVLLSASPLEAQGCGPSVCTLLSTPVRLSQSGHLETELPRYGGDQAELSALLTRSSFKFSPQVTGRVLHHELPAPRSA